MVLQRRGSPGLRSALCFNCEDINYGIATSGGAAPAGSPPVSIVKTSTMVLQPPTHLHVPGGPIVSIVKESTMVLQRRSEGATFPARSVSIVKESTMVLQQFAGEFLADDGRVPIVKLSTMVLQRLSLRGVAKATKCFNCEGINYGVATVRGRALGRVDGSVSIVKLSTMVLQRPSSVVVVINDNVSIVKTSTMVLQHVAERWRIGRRGFNCEDIEYGIATRLGRPSPLGQRYGFNCEDIDYGIATAGRSSSPAPRRGFNCEEINYGIATLMPRRGWRSKTATVRCSPGIRRRTARP